MTKKEAKLYDLEKTIVYNEDAVVSKTLINKPTGTVTLFSFDKGQGLSTHTSPFDALVHIIDGKVEITVDKTKHVVLSLVCISDDEVFEDYFYNFGKFLCKAIIENVTVDIKFSPLYYYLLLRKDSEEINFEDLFYLFYKDYDFKSFSFLEKILKTKDVNLIPFNECYCFINSDGKEEELSNYNKKKYVTFEIKKTFFGEKLNRKKNLLSIKKGFYCCLEKELQESILSLNAFELQRILFGDDFIDAEKLISQLKFTHSTKTEKIFWIKTFLRNSKNFYKKQFLLLSCSLTNLPFKLEKRITVKFTDNQTVCGHTCNFMVEIGVKYADYEKFRVAFEKLLDHVQDQGFLVV